MSECMDNSKCCAQETKGMLEHIRVKLFVMAMLPCFAELVGMKLHLYTDGAFISFLSKRMNVSRRTFGGYMKIAKVISRECDEKKDRHLVYEVLMNASDARLNYNMMADTGEKIEISIYDALKIQYCGEYDINFVILSKNVELLMYLLNEFVG